MTLTTKLFWYNVNMCWDLLFQWSYLLQVTSVPRCDITVVSESGPPAVWSETDRLLSRYLAAALTLAMLPAGEMWSVVTLSPRNSKTWAFSIDWGGGTSLLWDKRHAEAEEALTVLTAAVLTSTCEVRSKTTISTTAGRPTNLLKKDGERIYVDLWSQGKTTESGHSMFFQNVFPCWRESTVGTNAFIPSLIHWSLMKQTLDIQEGKKGCVLTSILPLRSLKMEEMTVSSSVCWTSSLDGQMSHR